MMERDIQVGQEMDLGPAPPENEQIQGIEAVRLVIGKEEKTIDQVDGPDGLFAQVKNRLTGMQVIASTSSHQKTFYAWDAIPDVMEDHLWNDTNFTRAMGNTCVLLAAVSDPAKVEAWIADAQFLKGLRTVLRDLYQKRNELRQNESYKGFQVKPEPDPQTMHRLKESFCKRSLSIIEKIIFVFEFLFIAGEGGIRDYARYVADQPERPALPEAEVELIKVFMKCSRDSQSLRGRDWETYFSFLREKRSEGMAILILF